LAARTARNIASRCPAISRPLIAPAKNPGRALVGFFQRIGEPVVPDHIVGIGIESAVVFAFLVGHVKEADIRDVARPCLREQWRHLGAQASDQRVGAERHRLIVFERHDAQRPPDRREQSLCDEIAFENCIETLAAP
jgi:hypothetical protein